jgi:hypothetical protein
VRFFSDAHEKVHTQLLDMCSTSGKEAVTAASIFAVVNEKLGVWNVPWSNCVAFSVDSASVNIGQRNSLMTRVQALNKSDWIGSSRASICP